MTPTHNVTNVWIHSLGPESDLTRETVIASLRSATVIVTQLNGTAPQGPGIVIVRQSTPEMCQVIRTLSRSGIERVLVLALSESTFTNVEAWHVLEAGASDVLVWNQLTNPGEVIASRLQRWRDIDELITSSLVRNNLVGDSWIWKSVLRQIVEVARFTDVPVLLMGETGTGKELVARLIHTLDLQRGKSDLVVLDCTTVVPELSGSELFGHERGAFTGATSSRDGAFALANKGSLFIDEIGELPLSLQIQLLRILQEHKYKRVGSNSWLHTDFRLICATNRDLTKEVTGGRFRRDLYYRIASWTIRLPPLRNRVEDILPLVRHLIQQARPNEEPLDLDERVQEYFLNREYPGNVRDLKNLVFRIVSRHVGPGPITIGDIPADEHRIAKFDASGIEKTVQRALSMGMNLQELKQTITETAIRITLAHEDGNIQRAAQKLGVTTRALQIRRAKERQQLHDVLNGQQ